MGLLEALHVCYTGRSCYLDMEPRRGRTIGHADCFLWMAGSATKLRVAWGKARPPNCVHLVCVTTLIWWWCPDCALDAAAASCTQEEAERMAYIFTEPKKAMDLFVQRMFEERIKPAVDR